MSKDTHEIPNTWLAAYHDNELDTARRQQVEAHLPNCAHCQHELEALRSLSSLLASDALPDQAMASEAVFWSELESHLPDRSPIAATPFSWLPGIGLLMLNGLVQLGAVAIVTILFIASQCGWGVYPVLIEASRSIASLILGWPIQLVPDQWSGLILIVSLIVFSVWLAVLYLAWLGYTWRYRWQAAAHTMI